MHRPIKRGSHVKNLTGPSVKDSVHEGGDEHRNIFYSFFLEKSGTHVMKEDGHKWQERVEALGKDPVDYDSTTD